MKPDDLPPTKRKTIELETGPSGKRGVWREVTMKCPACADTGKHIVKTPLNGNVTVYCDCPVGVETAKMEFGPGLLPRKEELDVIFGKRILQLPCLVVQKEETYTMIFTCCNCSTEFVREVKIGKTARGRGGVCSYCGVKDYDPGNSYGTFKHRKPLNGEVKSLGPDFTGLMG